MKIKKKTITDKVHELLENGNESSDESFTDNTAPRITEFDDDEYEKPGAQITEFRKRNIKLLSEQSSKYSGKISSRKELEDDDESASESEENFYEDSDESNDDELVNDELESDEEEYNKSKQKLSSDISDDENIDDEKQTEEEEEEEDNNEEEQSEEEHEDKDEEEENNALVSESNKQNEIQKGICVQNQLRIWEKLLELRINSQKILNKANQLPAPDEFVQISNIDENKQEICNNVANLLNKLCELQQTLIEQNSDVKENINKTKKSLTTNDILEENDLFTKQLNENFEEFRNYRNNVLLKWDDRIKLLTPNIGNKRKGLQEDYDVIKKIKHALNNSHTLIEKSQLLNNQQNLDNNDENLKRKAYIYDDSDFYHQQLRELIEYKANSTSNLSDVTRQYVELQKMRQKMKKKVDTRASKGRKIRYVIHKKLVNFMAPEDTSTWTEESKNELYKSLFMV